VLFPSLPWVERHRPRSGAGHQTLEPMARFKVVLTVINEDSVTPFVVGPRFRRGVALPMEKLYAERGGYWFDPETESSMAHSLADQFSDYVKRNETKTKKKKQ